MTSKCRICSFPTQILEYENLKADYHYCSNCKFISKDKKFILSIEDELKIYDNHNNSIDDPRYVDFFYDFLNSAVFDFVNNGKNGLDFGSGPSPVLSQILKRYHDYDMDIYDIYYSPEKTYLGKTYDLITCTEVIEHLDNPLPYFGLFHKLMKSDSILAVMTLFHKNDEEHFRDWNYARDKTHISFFTPTTFEVIAELTGFKVIYTNDERYITFMKS